MRFFSVLMLALAMSFSANASLIGFADVVLSYEDNNDDVRGRLNNGVIRDLSFTRALDGSITGEVADAVLFDNSTSFLSLKIGQSITLGFVDENIFDGVGNDIFISETGNVSESANIFVSSNGIDFVFLGEANNAGGVSSFDLADIGFSDLVTAVRIEGLSNSGSSPGFDLEFVEALNRVNPPPPVVTASAPGALLLTLLGFGALFARRTKK